MTKSILQYSNVTIEVKGSGGYAYIGDGTDRKVEVKKGSTVFIRATAAEGTGKKFAYWSTGNTVASGKGVILTNKNPYEFVAVENTSPDEVVASAWSSGVSSASGGTLTVKRTGN